MYASRCKYFGFVMLALSAWPAGATTMYTIQDLGAGTGMAINASGQVAGQGVSVGGQAHAFLWSGGIAQDLGVLAGFPASSAGFGINSAGQVVGQSNASGSSVHAALWSGGTITDMGTSGVNSVAFGINDFGMVAGRMQSATGGALNAVIWDGTSVKVLGQGFAYAINEFGQATGDSFSGFAFFWDGTTYRNIGTGYGLAINDSGKITGGGGAQNHAFFWNGTSMQDLGTLGGASSVGRGINNSNIVVGNSLSGTGVRAFVWDGNTMTDLNSILQNGAGWTLDNATAINDKGQITGSGTRVVNGQSLQRAFLLTPVPDAPPPPSQTPEPSTVVMALVGLSVVVIGRRR
jgi:probable HAF family extracellular repeat protein